MVKFSPKKPEKEIISIRISVETLKTIDAKAGLYEISRNELINQMIGFALDHMEDETND